MKDRLTKIVKSDTFIITTLGITLVGLSIFVVKNLKSKGGLSMDMFKFTYIDTYTNGIVLSTTDLLAPIELK